VHLARTGEVRKKPGVGVCFLVFLTRPPTLSTLPILATEAYLCARLASETTELAFLCGYLLGIIKTKPANSPSNFGHETPRAHLRFRCDLAPWLPSLSPSHGEDIHPQGCGHGGDRSKAGLPASYWQEKGGRAAAAAAKAAAKVKELLEEQAAKAAATNRWKQRAKHSD
jgi:hypothetical protein